VVLAAAMVFLMVPNAVNGDDCYPLGCRECDTYEDMAFCVIQTGFTAWSCCETFWRCVPPGSENCFEVCHLYGFQCYWT